MISSNVPKGKTIVWSTSHNIVEENHYIHNANEETTIFFQFIIFSRVSPSPQEQMKLLTHGGNIIMSVQMKYKGSNKYMCKSSLGFGIIMR
jgi:hypothetical protein